MSAQEEKPMLKATVKQRRRCKLCPRKYDRKVTLTCLECKELFCKSHLFFLCVDCISKQSNIPTSDEMHLKHVNDLKHRLQNLYKQNYCIFCNSCKYRKTSRYCDNCGLNICTEHIFRQCQNCKPYDVLPMVHM